MINQVSGTNLLQNYAVKPAVEQIKAEETKQPEIAQDIVKKETADATKAYACLVSPKPKAAPEKKSLDELKADFIAQGKVEGKDFTIDKDELSSKLTVMENEKPVKIYRYDKDGATKESFEAIQEFSYPVAGGKGLKQMETTYGADGEFHFRTFKYEKENSPYKDDIVNFETKPFELEKKLKDEGIKIVRDTEFVSENWFVDKITAFDPKTNEVTRYEFRRGKDDNIEEVTKCIIDQDGELKGDISFRKDETSYTEFQDSLKA